MTTDDEKCLAAFNEYCRSRSTLPPSTLAGEYWHTWKAAWKQSKERDSSMGFSIDAPEGCEVQLTVTKERGDE